MLAYLSENLQGTLLRLPETQPNCRVLYIFYLHWPLVRLVRRIRAKCTSRRFVWNRNICSNSSFIRHANLICYIQIALACIKASDVYHSAFHILHRNVTPNKTILINRVDEGLMEVMPACISINPVPCFILARPANLVWSSKFVCRGSFNDHNNIEITNLRSS